MASAKSKNDTDQDSFERQVVVSYESLSKGAVRGIIEAFVLQEGTDYGSHEFSLDQKVQQVMRQLELGKAEIIYDLAEESCDIRIKGQLQ